MKILFISGPNIKLMGVREKKYYGDITYDDMVAKLNTLLSKMGIMCDFFQSNHEGDLVEKIHKAGDEVNGIVINPAAYTHTSVAIRDALLATGIPAVEIHMSNVYVREDFRKRSMIEDIVAGKICGFGWYSYYLGALALINIQEGV